MTSWLERRSGSTRCASDITSAHACSSSGDQPSVAPLAVDFSRRAAVGGRWPRLFRKEPSLTEIGHSDRSEREPGPIDEVAVLPQPDAAERNERQRRNEQSQRDDHDARRAAHAFACWLRLPSWPGLALRGRDAPFARHAEGLAQAHSGRRAATPLPSDAPRRRRCR